MRKALIVGIDFYQRVPLLTGCVNDANSVQRVLARHGDGRLNFAVVLLTAENATEAVTRHQLKDAIADLFSGDSEIALLYFSGHGHIESTGGYLIPTDASRGDDGLPLGEVVQLANRCACKNRMIVLDSCHSGAAGDNPHDPRMAELTQGLTILSASTAEQYATEQNGSGVFTNLFVDALSGAAANLLGQITPGSVYAHIDQSLGPWEQRPVFKTNVKEFVSLRETRPPIPLADLLRITQLFPTATYEFHLDPSYEPQSEGRTAGMPPPDPVKNEDFATLQKYNRVNLVVPVGAPHMWHAAMEGKSCRLTPLGQHYHRLVTKGLL